MADPVGDIIGDYRAFATLNTTACSPKVSTSARTPLSHLAVRVAGGTGNHLRTLLERQATADHENVWNGRPISLILLATLVEVLDGMSVPLIGLIRRCTSASTRWVSSTSGSSSATR